jgi:hypothetical protein
MACESMVRLPETGILKQQPQVGGRKTGGQPSAKHRVGVNGLGYSCPRTFGQAILPYAFQGYGV